MDMIGHYDQGIQLDIAKVIGNLKALVGDNFADSIEVHGAALNMPEDTKSTLGADCYEVRPARE